MPLVTGAAVGLRAGGSAWRLAPLSMAVLALFWLRTPVESWIGSTPIKARSGEEIRLVKKAALILGAIATAALLWLFWGWRNRELILIGAIAAAAFIGQTMIRQSWRRAKMAAQLVGAAGLTSGAAAAYTVVTGQLNWTAWSLWILNLLFAANQIEFVQLRIHAAQAKTGAEKLSLGREFLAAQFVEIAILLGGCAMGLIGWRVSIAFLPVLWRGFAWFLAPLRPLVVHALGKRELLYAIIFGVLLILAML